MGVMSTTNGVGRWDSMPPRCVYCKCEVAARMCRSALECLTNFERKTEGRGEAKRRRREDWEE